MSLKIKPEYQEQVWSEISSNLDGFRSASSQHNWLQSATLGSKNIKVQSLLDANPELKTKVAMYMLGSFATKEGSRDMGFTLSSDVSDKDILAAIDKIQNNKKIIEEHPVFGDKDKMAELTDFIKNRNTNVKDTKKELKLLKNYILNQESEFKEGTYLPNPFEYGEEGEGMLERVGQWAYGVFNQPGLTNPGNFAKVAIQEQEDGSEEINPFVFAPAAITNAAIKWLIQATAGWQDLDWSTIGIPAGKKEGQDMIENYRFDYNYKTGEMGSDFFERIKPYKEKLLELDAKQNAIDSNTKEEHELYKTYEQLREDNRDLNILLNSTRFDEMLNYLSKEELIRQLDISFGDSE